MISLPLLRHKIRDRLLLAPEVYAWILNSDVTPVSGTHYIWDDAETWDDANIWKD